ncbi:unnamed protein product [Chilo suppressalis]|uniref:Uncharacterized protein n=1 Tax=Chilo suppressalis TaxID=168631 RepID=A0ABN8ATQ8_CHISP|nr:hypothetical protein evm_012425 [Chilo suppressalis]CAH0398373.1 unnamed protein product [Chilo suppressalis]
MISNRTTGPGTIKFDVLVTANIYVLNEEEIPSLTTMSSDILAVSPELYQRRLITIRNIENDASARMIKPEKRKCRYTDENFLEVYRHYSYTACTVQCRKNAQLRLCNCTNFFMPNVPEYMKCNISGIMCLNNHVNVLSVLKAEWSSRSGLYCNCLPSCTEAEITTVKDFKIVTSESFASVEIGLAMLPSERYKRNVVRGVLDLVGGACLELYKLAVGAREALVDVDPSAALISGVRGAVLRIRGRKAALRNSDPAVRPEQLGWRHARRTSIRRGRASANTKSRLSRVTPSRTASMVSLCYTLTPLSSGNPPISRTDINAS